MLGDIEEYIVMSLFNSLFLMCLSREATVKFINMHFNLISFVLLHYTCVFFLNYQIMYTNIVFIENVHIYTIYIIKLYQSLGF